VKVKKKIKQLIVEIIPNQIQMYLNNQQQQHLSPQVTTVLQVRAIRQTEIAIIKEITLHHKEILLHR